MNRRCYRCGEFLAGQGSSWYGLHVACFCAWFQLDTPSEFQDVIARSEEKSAADEWMAKVISSFFHGKFRKYSAQLGDKAYLLKVEQPEYPELPATEYLSNQIAHELGLNVPPHFLIELEENRAAFVCENFMQNYPGCDLVHIYRYLSRPEQFSCEGLLQVLEKELGRIEEVNSFINLCLFDALIGNHDRHGRNIGIIRSSRKSHLAPFYDNPSYLGIEEEAFLGLIHEPRGAIATKATSEPTMKDYVQEWIRLGFKEQINEFKNSINLPHIQKLMQGSFISPKRQYALSQLIERRYQELEDAYRNTSIP